MADNRNEIYDDESEGKGFYKKDRGVKKDAEARQGSLEEAENQATDASQNLTSVKDEAQAAGFSYSGGDSASSSTSSSSGVKKGLLGGGVIASLTGLIVSIFIGFLPLKLEYIIQNITARVGAATFETIENRMETVLGKYLTKRLITDRAGTNTYTGNSLFGSLYGNWRGAQFEEVLFREHGIRFEALRDGVPVNSNNQVPNGWRILQDGNARASFDTDIIDLDLLDTDIGSRDMRRAIRQATRETTKWNQVLKRRNLRRIMVNKYDVPDWKVPESVRNVQSSYSARKLAAKKWLVKRSIGPFSARYAAFFTCMLDTTECSDPFTQKNPDLSSNLPNENNVPNEPNPDNYVDCVERDPITNVCTRTVFRQAEYEADLDRWKADVADISGDNIASRADDISSPGTVDEITDAAINDETINLPESSRFENILARTLSSEFLKKLSTGILVVGVIDALASFDDCVGDGGCAKFITSMKAGNQIAAAAPFLTTNSQLLAGELDAESAGLIFDSLDGFEEHPIFAAEFGTLRQTASLGGTVFAQSVNIDYDCDGDSATDNSGVPLSRPICDHEVIRSDFGSWTESEIYQFFKPVLDFWSSTFGKVIDWFEVALEAIIGPVLDQILEAFPWIGEALNSFIEWALGKVFTPPCTGAEVGGATYSCIRGGLEATYAQIGEEAVNGIGGEYLSDEQWRLLQADYEEQLAWEWQQEPLTTRIFSTDSYRSMLARAVIHTPDSVHGAAQNVASLVTNPLKTIGSMFGNFTSPVTAQGTAGFNPYGIVHYGYTSNDEVLVADPEESDLFANCELNVLPESYDDPRQLGMATDPSAPPWEVYVTSDPCALERTVVEIGSSLFGGESGGLSYDYEEYKGAEFYSGEIDEVFGIHNYAGASW